MRLPRFAPALIAGACLGACAGASKTSSDPCADFEVELEHYWSASIRAQVLEQRAEIELERRKGVVNKMDRISEDWVMMRTSVCKDHFVRQLISKEEYAARVTCFDDRLAQQRSLATALSGSEAVEDIESSLDTLLSAPPSCEQAQTD